MDNTPLSTFTNFVLFMLFILPLGLGFWTLLLWMWGALVKRALNIETRTTTLLSQMLHRNLESQIQRGSTDCTAAGCHQTVTKGSTRCSDHPL